MAADPAVRKEFLDVEEAAGSPVHLVLGRAVPIEASGDRDLGEVDREESVAVVEGERHLGTRHRRPGRRPGKHHILHLLSPEGPGGLRTHDPGDRVEQVGLSGAVRPHHDVHPGVEFEPGPVGERLKADKRELLQQHSGGA